jgi:TonB family protein
MRILNWVLLVTILGSFISCEDAEKKASKKNSQTKAVIQRTPAVKTQLETDKQTRRIIAPEIPRLPYDPFDPEPGYEPTPYYFGEPTVPYPIIEPIKVNEDTIFDFASFMPEFPGGQQAFMNYISSNLIYPEIAKEIGMEGKVIVSFVVFEDGTIHEATILRGIKGDGSCDKEALRLINQMPKWIPGKREGGELVKVRVKIPVMFKLN